MATQTEKEQFECEGYIASATPGKYSTIVEIVTSDGETVKADFKDEWKVAPLIEVSLKNKAPFRWTGYVTDKGYKKVTWGFKEEVVSDDWSAPREEIIGADHPAINEGWTNEDSPYGPVTREVESAWAIEALLLHFPGTKIDYEVLRKQAVELVHFKRLVAADLA